jgi:2-aminoadipate transaminase
MTMDYSKIFSDRAKRMRASEIRQILAVTQRSDVISFAGGLPNPATFPKKEILEATDWTLKNHGNLALQYSPTEGIPELREEVAKYLNRDGTKYDKDSILITNGSQQGLDLLGRLFLDPGSKVLVGSPTYLGAIQAFENYLVREKDFVPVKSDDQGMTPDSIEETLLRLQREGTVPKFIYTVPTFQNPAGTVSPESRRRKILELAYKFDTFIVEDDPYGQLRFDGEPVKKYAALDKEGDRVVYLGTFSKILVPGFRLAWTAGPKKLMEKMAVGKQAMDLCTNAFTQFITFKLMKDGLIDHHLPQIIKLYRHKRDLMMKALAERMPKENTTWTKAQGGLFTFLRTDKAVDSSKMLMPAIKNGVAYVPGNSFFVDFSGPNTMRLNFSHPTDEQIPIGVDRLAKTIEAELKSLKRTPVVA